MKIEKIIELLSLPKEKRTGVHKLSELKNVEFKQEIPEDSLKYLKTIVAYANTQGGILIIGVEDETLEVVGVSDSELFQLMDSIANAVSDACEPQIIPDIEPYTVNGKTIIVVSVSPAYKRPYYLKSKGRDNGTYIRVGATTRLAYPEKIRELLMEGANVSWDELNCIGFQITEEAIDKLCKDMNDRRKRIQQIKELKEELPIVTRTNLENWKVIRNTEDGYQASNAFALLTSDYFQFSKIQCAVFKGTERVVFLEKREYTGPLYNQIDEALSFVLRNIRLRAIIDGLQRREEYELPVKAIREMIVNAVCHRNFRDESCVQVSVYDNRVEVLSPGGLYNGLTFEEATNGHSKFRNRAIANVFNQIGFVEGWGTGLKRIRDDAKEYGLPEPEFIEMPQTIIVNLYRDPLEFEVNNNNDLKGKSINFVDINNHFAKNKLNKMQAQIIYLMTKDNTISALQIAEQLNVTVRAVEINIKIMREKGFLLRHGADRNGYWEIKDL